MIYIQYRKKQTTEPENVNFLKAKVFEETEMSIQLKIPLQVSVDSTQQWRFGL